MGFNLNITGYKDGKEVMDIEYGRAGTPILHYIAGYNGNKGNVSWNQLNRIYTLYTIIDYLRPANHPLEWPHETSTTAKVYWRLHIEGEEIDDVKRFSLIGKETYEKDTEIYCKLKAAYDELIDGDLMDAYVSDDVDIHFFDSAREYRYQFEKMIQKLNNGEIDKVEYNGGY